MTEDELCQELIAHVVKRMSDEKFGLYRALRILGYVMVAAAEGVNLEGENDDAGN